MCPVNRRQTHRAWFAAGIDFAAAQIESLQFCTCSTYGDDFSMRSRVVTRYHLIVTFANNLPVFNNHCAKRAAAVIICTLTAKRYGMAHELFSLFLMSLQAALLCLRSIPILARFRPAGLQLCQQFSDAFFINLPADDDNS